VAAFGQKTGEVATVANGISNLHSGGYAISTVATCLGGGHALAKGDFSPTVWPQTLSHLELASNPANDGARA
jgi:hypothetical protein